MPRHNPDPIDPTAARHALSGWLDAWGFVSDLDAVGLWLQARPGLRRRCVDWLAPTDDPRETYALGTTRPEFLAALREHLPAVELTGDPRPGFGGWSVSIATPFTATSFGYPIEVTRDSAWRFDLAI